jgi:hypothetical protein
VTFVMLADNVALSAVFSAALVVIRIVASKSSIVVAARVGFAAPNGTEGVFSGSIRGRMPRVIATHLMFGIVAPVAMLRRPAWQLTLGAQRVHVIASAGPAIVRVGVVAAVVALGTGVGTGCEGVGEILLRLVDVHGEVLRIESLQLSTKHLV